MPGSGSVPRSPEQPLPGSWWRWLCVWTVVSCPGVCLALIAWGVGTVVGCTLTIAAVTALFYVTSDTDAWQRRSGDVVGALRATIQVSVCAAVLGAGLILLTSLSGPLAVIVATCVAASTPPSIRLAHRLTGLGSFNPQDSAAVDHERLLPLPPLAVLAPAAAMSNSDLCAAWRRSFVSLQESRSVVERERVVRLRQGYLDELETRDATALEAWLASGARAASSPEQFLCHGDGERPGVA